MKQYLMAFPDGRLKALALSYDDGRIHDRRLVEIFNKHGIKGTFHLNSGSLGSENTISKNEVRSLMEGHEVSVHTVTHPHLEDLPLPAVIQEILDDRAALEDIVQYPVRGMSYPFGTFTDEIVKLLPALGIEYSRTVHTTGNFSIPSDFGKWSSTCHHNANLMVQAEKFKTLEPKRASLFYIWGHSYEFDREKNWDLIENFCSYISNDLSIWYTTTIELVDYIKAFQSLRFSFDGTIVQNPTSRKLFFKVDNKFSSIDSGQTIVFR